MKNNNLFLFLVLSISVLNAQNNASNTMMTEQLQVPLFVNNAQFESLEGIPYFYDDHFHKGEVMLTQNRHFSKDYKYKFDQISNTVLLQYPDGEETLLDAKDILSFKMFIGDKTINFVKTNLPYIKEPTIVQVIYLSSKMRLFRDIKKKIIKNKEYISYTGGEVPSKIINDYSYYFSKNDEQLMFIKPNKKDFIKALPEKKAEIERIFKTKAFNDLTVNKLVELMQKLDDDK
jgi:hypothetical protein